MFGLFGELGSGQWAWGWGDLPVPVPVHLNVFDALGRKRKERHFSSQGWRRVEDWDRGPIGLRAGVHIGVPVAVQDFWVEGEGVPSILVQIWVEMEMPPASEEGEEVVVEDSQACGQERLRGGCNGRQPHESKG